MITGILVRVAVAAGLVAVFVALTFRSGYWDTWEDQPASDRPTPAATSLPAPEFASAPPLLGSALPAQDQVCNNADSKPPVLTEIDVLSSQGEVITRIYCSGSALKYVTSLDQDGMVERTYRFENGLLRIKLYHNDGDVVKRVDFDEEGNPVPDGTFFAVPNTRIGPGREEGGP